MAFSRPCSQCYHMTVCSETRYSLTSWLAVSVWGAPLGDMQRCRPRGGLQRGAHSWRQKAWKARASASFRYAGVRSQPPPNQAPPPTCSPRPPHPAGWLDAVICQAHCACARISEDEHGHGLCEAALGNAPSQCIVSSGHNRLVSQATCALISALSPNLQMRPDLQTCCKSKKMLKPRHGLCMLQSRAAHPCCRHVPA